MLNRCLCLLLLLVPTAVAEPGVHLVVVGPDALVTGQPATVEVFVLNQNASAVTGLVLTPRADAGLNIDETPVELAAIAPNDVAVVRLGASAAKVGAAGIEFALTAGAKTERVRQVWPVAADRPAVGEPLRYRLIVPNTLFVDRPGFAFVRVWNAGTDATESLALRLRSITPALPFDTVAVDERLTAPRLEPGEAHTVAVRFTPRRAGELPLSLLTFEPQPALAIEKPFVRFDRRLLAEAIPTRTETTPSSRLPRTLAEVPEISLMDAAPAGIRPEAGQERVGKLISTIHNINADRRDGFVEGLLQHRADLCGLPVVMGDDCRLSPEKSRALFLASLRVRSGVSVSRNLMRQMQAAPLATGESESVAVATLMQAVGHEKAAVGGQAIRYLDTLQQADATKALARLVIFSDIEFVRTAALDALVKRKDEAALAEMLTVGLAYPWPDVAQRAAETAVKLDRKDLLPKLVEMLERPDPRLPVEREDGHTVGELVKINHLQNCLLCHAPAAPALIQQRIEASRKRRDLLERVDAIAPVAIPGQRVPTASSGMYYQPEAPNVPMVSFDVTYLRQDFSVELPVADANPWPEMQRFDFVVRTRAIAATEADAIRTQLQGDTTYRDVALSALRALTGRSATTADEWRKILNQPR